MADGGTDLWALALKLRTDGQRELEAALDSVNKKGQDVSKGFDNLGNVIKGAFGALLASEAFKLISETVDEAAELEHNMALLTNTVKGAGDSWKDFKGEISDTLAQLAATSTFSDEELVGALTRLTQITGDTGLALKNMGLVADFAAGRGLDLETAATLVGKALEGNFTQLQRLGIQATSTEDAMHQLQTRFGGDAQADANTYSGAVKLQANALKDLKETIGLVIIENGGLREAQNKLRLMWLEAAKFVDQNREQIGAFIHVLADLVEFIAGAVGDAFKGMIGFFKLLEVGIVEVVAGFEGMMNDIKHILGLIEQFLGQWVFDVGVKLGPLGGAFVKLGLQLNAAGQKMAADAQADNKLIQDALEKTIDDILNGTKALDKDTEAHKNHHPPHAETNKDLETEAADLAAVIGLRIATTAQLERAQVVYATLSERMKAHNLTLKEEVALQTAINTLLSARNATRNTVKGDGGLNNTGKLNADVEAANALSGAGGIMATGMGGAGAPGELSQSRVINQTKKKLQDQIVDLRKSLKATVDDQFLHIGDNLGDVLSQSLSAAFEGGFKNAGKVALQGLGSIMQQMGKSLLTYGLAMVNLLPALSNPFTSGPAAIAVGAILLALGGALGGIATGSGGGGGGGSVSSSGIGTITQAQQTTTYILKNTTAGGAGSKVQPMQPQVFNVFGSNDPLAQRAIVEAYDSGKRRGV